MSEPTLSVVILHHGPVEVLAQRLQEVATASQIIILEDPSQWTPQVQTLARKSKAQVILHALDSDFSQHRNAVFPYVTSEWTLFLDQDESVSLSLWREIQQTLQHPQHDCYLLPRRDVFLGRELKFGETGQMELVRLARTAAGIQRWQRAIHETWQVPGSVGRLQSPLLHTPHPSVTEFLQKLLRYASLEPGARAPLSRRKVLFELVTYPPAKFFKALFWQQGFRDGTPGWIHAFLMAYYSLIVRVYCWEAWHGQQ